MASKTDQKHTTGPRTARPSNLDDGATIIEGPIPAAALNWVVLLRFQVDHKPKVGSPLMASKTDQKHTPGPWTSRPSNLNDVASGTTSGVSES